MKTFLAALLLTGSVLAEEWETLETKGRPRARHEAAFVEFDGEFYLVGGRRIQEVSIFNPEKNEWRSGAKPPVEVHHFQPVVYEDKIMIICAMTGKFPNETGLEKILIYEPKKNQWSWGDEIPEARRRGSAGVVNVAGEIYVIAGIVNGHMGGYVNWADRYDPKTGKWTRLKDAKHQRDHFQAAYLDGKIYAAGGRTTSKETGQVFALTVPEVDVYDIKTAKWSVLKKDLPTPRAGNSTAAIGKDIVVAGGESGTQKTAHDEVEAWNTEKEKWHDYPNLKQGRHGTALILHENCIYTCSGSGGRGGGPELKTTERLKLNP